VDGCADVISISLLSDGSKIVEKRPPISIGAPVGSETFTDFCDVLEVGQLEGGFLERVQIFFSIQRLTVDIREYTLGRYSIAQDSPNETIPIRRHSLFVIIHNGPPLSPKP